MAYQKLAFRVHAIQRMFERHFNEMDIQECIELAEVIEGYPNDTPYPSRLVMGSVRGRPIHIVLADNAEAKETVVITVYEPDPKQWETDFRRRRKE